MADLGSIGTDAQGAQRRPLGYIRTIMCGDDYQVLGGKDTTEGSPSQPSLKMDAKGSWKFRWAVASGARTISIPVKQAANASPRPSLVVRANPAIGVNADVTATAAAGAGWVTIGPASINPSADGAVEVELLNNLDRQLNAAPCYFDTESIATT